MAKNKSEGLDKDKAKLLDKLAKDHAKHMQEMQATLNQYQQIQKQIEASAKKSEEQRQQIMQETQTKIMETQRDIQVNRTKSADKMQAKVTQLLKN